MQAKFKPRPHLIQEGKSDEELFEIFLDLCEQHLAKESRKKYIRVMQNFQQFLKAKKLKITDFRSETADAWLAQWKGKPVAKQQYAIILQRFLGFLGILDPRNGVHVDVPMKRKNKIEEIRRQLINKEELDVFLKVCDSDHRSALLASILWESGLRCTEVASLKWKHVNVEKGLIEVPKRKGGMIDSVPFGLNTVTFLRLLNYAQRDPEGPLFESKTRTHRGQPLSSNGVYYVVNQYGKLAGWRKEQCHPQAFRHSCATYLVRSGMPLASVMEIMNHRQITTTMIYTHLAEDDVLNDYRRIMRPDLPTPDEEGPTEPETCPKCGIKRLRHYLICPNPDCGYDYRPQDSSGIIHREDIKEIAQHVILEVLTNDEVRRKLTPLFANMVFKLDLTEEQRNKLQGS